MSLTSLLPVLAALGFLGFATYVLTRPEAPARNAWLFPALLSFAFLLFSLHVVATEGAFGFWAEHTRNLSGNQIWLDLLLAVGIGWFLVLPQARVLGMRLVPWLVLIVCTGSIGLLAMTARVLYLRERSTQ